VAATRRSAASSQVNPKVAAKFLLVGGRGPFERLGALVVPVDEGVDVGLQLTDRSMNASLESLSGELRKPALDLTKTPKPA
jgi:hypothetical protein